MAYYRKQFWVDPSLDNGARDVTGGKRCASTRMPVYRIYRMDAYDVLFKQQRFERRKLENFARIIDNILMVDKDIRISYLVTSWFALFV